MSSSNSSLKQTLSGFHLWGIAVGLVISGSFFGWSYGWASAGTLGFLIVVLLIALMYCCFIFSLTELSTAIPHAGGPFAYALRAFGPTIGFCAGFSTLIEFVFAPPAIAMAIGAYINVQFPFINTKLIACTAFLLFMGLNIIGVHIAATFELVVTLLAIFALILFMVIVAPTFSWEHFANNGWGGQNQFHFSTIEGMLAATPFAIWFFLAIEGASMAAEEAKDPQRTIPKALGAGIITVTLLALFIMLFAGGAKGDWRLLANINDPLPQAMKAVVGAQSIWLNLLVWLGLFGLIASLHGIIMGYSRQIFSLAREGYLPSCLAKVNKYTHTPYIAILTGGFVGIGAIFSDSLIIIANQPLTASIMTVAAFGALLMYILSMASLFKLRRSEPNLYRPFKAILYPFAPLFAMIMSIICLITMALYNLELAGCFIGFMGIGYLYFLFTRSSRSKMTK